MGSVTINDVAEAITFRYLETGRPSDAEHIAKALDCSASTVRKRLREADEGREVPGCDRIGEDRTLRRPPCWWPSRGELRRILRQDRADGHTDAGDEAEEAHTPGPWYAVDDGAEVHDRPTHHDEDGARIGETPCGIAVIEWHPTGGDAAKRANARLIAAAPTMLKVLRGVIHHDNALQDDARLSPSLIAHVERTITQATKADK